MPENPIPTTETRKYKDSSVLIPYTDPFSKNEFYPVTPSEANINNPNVFFIEQDDSGNAVYGTYNKDDKGIEYLKQTVREYEDGGPQNIFSITPRLNDVLAGKNPYTNRKYLQDYETDVYNNPALNQRLTEAKNRFAPAQVAQVTPQQRGDDYINRLKTTY